jgi:hypothetical protein
VPEDPLAAGYDSHAIYTLFAACGQQMFYMSLNEDFFGAESNQGDTNNWLQFSNQGEPFFITGGFGDFADQITMAANPNSIVSPKPQPPNSPLSTRWMIRYWQRLFVGSKTPGVGSLVQQDRLTYYLDHGDVHEIQSPLP